MTDYNLLAKEQIEKYTSGAISFSDTAFRQAKVFAATAQQGIIDAFVDLHAKVFDNKSLDEIEAKIKHLNNLKEAILNYKP